MTFAQTIWNGAESLTECSPAATYLQFRGVDLQGCSALRWHPAAPRSKRPPDSALPPAPPHGVMVAAVRIRAAGFAASTPPTSPRTGAKPLTTAPASCSAPWPDAVQFAPVGHEGVGRSGRHRRQPLRSPASQGFPTWASLSTAGLLRFEPPAGPRRLMIAADADDNGAGLRAAQKLAEQIRRRCDVVVQVAPEGLDFNDVLTGGQHG